MHASWTDILYFAQNVSDECELQHMHVSGNSAHGPHDVGVLVHAFPV